MEQFRVALPNGRTLLGAAYKKEGTIKNIVIHTGMDEHATRYEPFAQWLNTHGYDVYVLDAEGQGLNAKSEADQQKWLVGSFFDSVDALNIKIEELKKETGRPIVLMGHSMGSFMVQSYLEKYPNTVDKVIICGTNGPAKAKMHMAYLMACLTVTKGKWDKPSKLLENAGLGAYTKAVVNRKTNVDWLSYNEENVKMYIADPYCGHHNTCGFWKEFLRGMDSLYQKKNLAKISKDEHILIIAGEDDPVGECGKGPRRLKDMYVNLGVKDVTLHMYEHMRHEILNERDHDKVYRDIKEFI
jgi:alpha-beta hydrolase superfamily lysophospholipase